MSIRVYYVSRRSELREFVSSHPDVVNDYEYMTRNGIRCEVIAKREDELRSLVMNDFLHDRENLEGCILLLEQGLEAVASRQLKIVAFTCVFELTQDQIASPQNVIARDVVKAVKFFRSVRNAVQSDQGVWRLPVNNFHSDLFVEFVNSMIQGFDVRNANEMLNLIQAQMQSMRKRFVRPKRKTNYPNKYCVDDSKRFFELGHEVHSKIDTASPHIEMCIALNSFRFGVKLSEEHHYNVSMGEGDDTWVDGAFLDCHGGNREVRRGEGKTHLNMFSNDFF